jgi:hypothetical protein
VPPAAIDAFFTGGASIAVQHEEDAVIPSAAVTLEKFEKMLRVGTDVGAVKQKMSAAGVTPAAMDAFFALQPHPTELTSE